MTPEEFRDPVNQSQWWAKKMTLATYSVPQETGEVLESELVRETKSLTAALKLKITENELPRPKFKDYCRVATCFT